MAMKLQLVALCLLSLLLVSTAQARLNAPTFRLENPVLQKPSQTIPASSPFNITAGVQGRDEKLAFVLETNHDITTKDAHVQYLDVHGNVRHSEPLIDSAHTVTRGSAWMQLASNQAWRKVGWARMIMLRDGVSPLFEGAFSIMSEEYKVQIDESGQGQLIVHRTSAGGLPSFPYNELQLQSPTCLSTPESGLYKRQYSDSDYSLVDTIGSTSGCPSSRQVAYIGVATDCSYTADFNSTDSVRSNILNVVNTAAVIFENSFNITLGLRNVTISDSECPSSSSSSSEWNSACSSGDTDWRLREFSSWRSSLGDDNAYWTLLTGCTPSSGEVGVSWVGELCNSGSSSSSSSSGVSANVVARTSTEWQVFAHESAHTFGAVHDCDSSTCASGANNTNDCCPLSSSTCNAAGQYLMNPTASQGMTRFSPCTIGNVCTRIGSRAVSTRCLVSASSADESSGTVINNSTCGNGVVEAGEACDCGGDNCSDEEKSCCDSMTCQWEGGSQCSKYSGVGGSQDDDGLSSWVHRHLKLVIGLSAGVGGALVLAMVGAVIGCCCRRSKQKKAEQMAGIK